MKLMRRAVAIVAVTAATALMNPVPQAGAITSKCGVSASWNTMTDSTSKVKITLSWRYVNEDKDKVQVCAKVDDRTKNRLPVSAEIRFVGTDDSNIVKAWGGNSVTILATSDVDTYAISVRGQIKSSWPWWNLLTWNRELDG